jgi:hypothetical protein
MPRENSRAKNATKIPLPTRVDCHLVTLAVVVKKPIVAAQNAAFVVLVNQVLDKTVPAQNARLVNLVPQTMLRLILVRRVVQDIIKTNLVKLHVYHVYQENTKQTFHKQIVSTASLVKHHP